MVTAFCLSTPRGKKRCNRLLPVAVQHFLGPPGFPRTPVSITFNNWHSSKYWRLKHFLKIQLVVDGINRKLLAHVTSYSLVYIRIDLSEKPSCLHFRVEQKRRYGDYTASHNGSHLHSHCWQNLKSHTICTCLCRVFQSAWLPLFYVVLP